MWICQVAVWQMVIEVLGECSKNAQQNAADRKPLQYAQYAPCDAGLGLTIAVCSANWYPWYTVSKNTTKDARDANI